MEPLTGDYRPDHDPIRVWQREDGSLQVISGRHRLDAAKRAGASRIMAYVYREDAQHDELWARRYDIESNIRDNQATPLEVALYVRGEYTGGTPLTDEEVARAGIDRKGKMGSVGYQIGREAGDSVMDAMRNGLIDDREALAIAHFCPNDETVQRVGLKMALDGASKAEIQERMAAEVCKQEMQQSLGLGGTDLFGNAIDDDAFMTFCSKYVVRRRNELAKDAQYLRMNAGRKNSAEMAKKYGVNVNDPDALRAKLKELDTLRERWKHPYTDPELLDEIREAFRAENPDAGVSANERVFKEYAENADALQDALMTVEDYSVIGRRAETWGNYDESRRFRGLYDGKMRVELDSSRFAYRPVHERKAPLGRDGMNALIRAVLRSVFDNIEYVTDREKRLRAVGNSLDRRIPGAKINDAVLARFVETHSSVSDADIDDLIKRGVVGTQVDSSACWKLEDVLDAPELYAAYPELREMPVSYADLGAPNIRGESYGEHIIINEKNKHAKEQADTLLHEIQHLIQEIEGFAEGSSQDYARRQLDNAIRREEESLARAEKAKEGQAVQVDSSSARGVHRHGNAFRRNASKERLARLKSLRRRAVLSNFDLAGLIRAVLGLPKRDFDYELYRRSAGEIEARAVSRRRRMTALQRELHPFNRDAAQEYGEYGAIVIFPSEDFSVAGVKAAGIEDARKRGVTYVDPADGKEKFVIPLRDKDGTLLARLNTNFTNGQLYSIPLGGHRDVSLEALLHYDELYKNYPELRKMRVRLYNPTEDEQRLGYSMPAWNGEAAYIGINVRNQKAYFPDMDARNADVLNTLLHETQHAVQHYEGMARGANTAMSKQQCLDYIGSARTASCGL